MSEGLSEGQLGRATDEAINRGIAFALESMTEYDWFTTRVICIDKKCIKTIAIADIVPAIKKALVITD
ncbi:MAG: hypothetical protein KME22_05585 [Hassallia sp. WJT32-NPBG1]|nr:hypothetical protein [Hassallia sp. WJT32-NPBG1]